MRISLGLSWNTAMLGIALCPADLKFVVGQHFRHHWAFLRLSQVIVRSLILHPLKFKLLGKNQQKKKSEWKMYIFAGQKRLLLNKNVSHRERHGCWVFIWGRNVQVLNKRCINMLEKTTFFGEQKFSVPPTILASLFLLISPHDRVSSLGTRKTEVKSLMIKMTVKTNRVKDIM